MPLVFLPDVAQLFLWGAAEPAPFLGAALAAGASAAVQVVTPKGREQVAGTSLPLLEVVRNLAVIPAADIPSLSGSVATWTLASKLALDLASRERVVPTLTRQQGKIVARWGCALSAPEDAAAVAALARSMPPSAHAVPASKAGGLDVWTPEALLRAFLDAVVDALVRTSRGGPALRHASNGARRRRTASADEDFARWEERWQLALSAGAGDFAAQGFAERTLLEDVSSWSEAALGARDKLRACFRLELPDEDGAPFVVRFLLQSPDDPSLLVTASEVWTTRGTTLAKLGRAFREPQESLLEALGRAARLFPPIASTLAVAAPEKLELAAAAAWQFLSEGAPALAEAGFGVIVPAELTASGQRRLRLRMRVTGKSKVAGAVAGAAALGMGELSSFQWEAALGDETLSAQELEVLAKHKASLVRYRGQWVAIDPGELAEIERRLVQRTGTIPMQEAVALALAGDARREAVSFAVSAGGVLADVLTKLRDAATSAAEPPGGFSGSLRPYQARGLAWLQTLAEVGLGGCLADDMGLGKTVQLLAFLLHRAQAAGGESSPALLVAPTSVLGNWEREAARFAPRLRIVRHYGNERARAVDDMPRGADTLVITSYGLLRRDAELLGSLSWSTLVLDEAQNIKNAASATAKVARALRAAQRFALTGTPVENRLAELWSIFEFANPGLLGSLEVFRREFAVPVERYGNERAAARLRRICGPFLLRRLKSDPSVIQDLPPKNEMKVVCTLTREQASLYQAAVNEEMKRVESAEGMERRGRVLALLVALKQICNHPAQYLGDAGPLHRRSGKLDRTLEMLEEVVAEGDKALVFTQFREMGQRLQQHLTERLGVEVALLHGGTQRKARDEMVRRFQEEPRGPRIFVLSVKAGGTGLNLTAASHVFHYDRWWNPSVEDQATDRAYRIGQRRTVQVHKLVCAGTLEEKIDGMLERKRALATKVIGAGEKWITELGNDELRELFSLSRDAAIGADDDRGEGASSERPPPRRRGSREVRP